MFNFLHRFYKPRNLFSAPTHQDIFGLKKNIIQRFEIVGVYLHNIQGQHRVTSYNFISFAFLASIVQLDTSCSCAVLKVITLKKYGNKCFTVEEKVFVPNSIAFINDTGQ